MPRHAPRWLFLHVPKTGGTTFNAHIETNFRRDEIWPGFERDRARFVPGRLYSDVRLLQRMSTQSWHHTRVFRGHFPYAATEVLGAGAVTITFLRDAVSRTISWLDHARRKNPEHAGMTLEAIYEDEWFRTRFLQDAQTRLFSLTLDEVTDSRPRSESGGPARAYYSAIGFALNHVITVDDDRLARACEHVSAVDVLGTTDDYCAALAVLESRFGWVIRSVPRRNAGRAPEVSESFRRRIAADNAYDTALYEYARARRSRP